MRSELSHEQKRFYNLATAASITGFVRAYLWRAISAIRRQGGLVIYCDTDCVVFSGIEPRDTGLQIGSNLGEWSSEGVMRSGGVAGRKLYAFLNSELDKNANEKWKTASKGARLSPDEIMQVARGETVVYQQAAPVYSLRKEPQTMERRIKRTK